MKERERNIEEKRRRERREDGAAIRKESIIS